jgi:hypothetical protein
MQGNTKEMDVILHFLLSQLDPEWSARECRHVWPPLDKSQARQFRSLVASKVRESSLTPLSLLALTFAWRVLASSLLSSKRAETGPQARFASRCSIRQGASDLCCYSGGCPGSAAATGT